MKPHKSNTTSRKGGTYEDLMTLAHRLSKHNTEQALTLYREALSKIKIAKDKHQLADCFFGIGAIEFQRGNYSKAWENLTSALTHLKQDELKRKIEIWNSLGQIKQRLGDYESALQWYVKVSDASGKINYKEFQAGALNNIGSIYAQTHRYQEALSYREQALALFRDIKNEQGEAATLTNIGNVYFYLNDFEKALTFFEESLKLRLKSGKEETTILPISNIGSTLFRLGRQAEGLDKLRESLKIAQGRGDKLMQIRNLIFLAQSHTALKGQEHLQRAKAYALEAEKLNEQMNSRAQAVEINDIQSEIAMLLQDWKSAYEFQRRASDIRLALLNEDSDERMKRLQVAFEVERKEKENELLRGKLAAKENELLIYSQFLINGAESQSEMRERLLEIKSKVGSNAVLEKHLAEIEKSLNPKRAWSTFEREFNKAHPSFFSALSKQFPTLSPTELKVSALLRIGHSTKEIAQLLFLSAFTVSDHRAAIRKKLKIKGGQNLSAFLAQF
jgi:tetratricopeptide (TPR) repeat protein